MATRGEDRSRARATPENRMRCSYARSGLAASRPLAARPVEPLASVDFVAPFLLLNRCLRDGSRVANQDQCRGRGRRLKLAEDRHGAGARGFPARIARQRARISIDWNPE